MLAQLKRDRLAQAMLAGIVLIACFVCVIFSRAAVLLVSSRDRSPGQVVKAVPPIEEPAEITPAATETPLPSDTPVPTDTPEPTSTPIPGLAFAEIVQHPDERGWNEDQYSAYVDTLEGQAVNWSGTIMEIKEAFGGEPYLSLDIEPGEPKIDAYVYVDKEDFLKVGVGQIISFGGTIRDKWPEDNGFYALEIKEGVLLELGEIATPTPAPPTDTPLPPTETPTPGPPTSTPGPTDTPTPDIGGEIEAKVMCRDFVRDNLKSPDSADFGGFWEEREKAGIVDAETAGQYGIDTSTLHNTVVWVVTGQVDAQNAFGVMLRSEYVCIMDYDSRSETWYLLDISIE